MQLNIYTSPYTSNPTPVLSQAVDLSASSSSCVVNADASRTCTIGLALAAGTYDVRAVTYDQAPSGGALSGNTLAYGFVAAESITPGQANTLTIALAGIPASVHVSLPVSHVDMFDGLTQDASVAVLDAGGSVIIGNFVDASGNSVTVSMSDAANTNLVTFNPSSFSASQATGVGVTYSPANLTRAQGLSGTSATITATLSSGASGNQSLQIPPAVTSYAPTVLVSTAPHGITTGSDGNVYVAVYSGASIAQIVPASVTASTISISAQMGPTPWPEDVTSGPDGRIWFTATNASAAGAMTVPSGIVSSYALTFPSSPMGIASDGTNLWVAENLANKIAMITTGGVVTEYPLPTNSSSPEYIAKGADGNMWFTERAATGHKVGMIRTSGAVGAVSEYPIPAPSAYPLGICEGSDGNIWVAEQQARNLAVVTTAGSITEIPTPNVALFFCTSGTDGNVWVTGYELGFGGVILRVHPSSHIVDTLPAPWMISATPHITQGPNGLLWATDTATGNVYTIEP